MALDYKKTINVRKVNSIPKKGLWVPISVAAQMGEYSDEMVRHLYKNRVIDSVRFARGPILVNYDDLVNNWIEPNRLRKRASSK